MVEATNPTATFRQEAAELLTQLEAALLDLNATPEDRALVDTAFRALHTLKGSGAMFGFDDLAAFTHHIENAYDLVRNDQLAVSKTLVDLTLTAMDHIRVLIDAPEHADTAQGQAMLDSFQTICGTAATPAQAAAAPAKASRDPAHASVYRVRFRPGKDVLRIGTNPLMLLNELRDLGDCVVVPLTDAVPPLETLDPTGCYLAWDVLLTTHSPRSAIDDVFIFVADVSDITVDLLADEADQGATKRLGDILVDRGDVTPEDLHTSLGHQPRLGELLVTEGKVSTDQLNSALAEQQHLREAAQARQSAASAASVRVPAERLDSLMDQVGEMVIAQARLTQLATSSSDLMLKSISEEIGRLAAELRDTTMSIRMVPIGTLFNKFRRVVHDLSRELGKEVELSMSGEDTELDKTVIENINDPLVHLIRNAIDHGLETAETRRGLGKPASGRVHLSAAHSGAQVLITINDDGRGMDRVAIRAKAEEKGLLTPGQEVSDSDLFGLVLKPGFSTAKTVTSISGRGVGMDVVKRTIDTLRGQVEVTSTANQGSAITLRLPLTLAIIDGLLVQVASGRYVIPLAAIEECVELGHDEDQRSSGRSFLNIRDEIVPFLRLRDLFKCKGQPEETQKVVIVTFGTVRVGLVVDVVIGQYQTVIKSLSKLHKGIEGFSGATILGDGAVALILDIPHLIKFAQQRETSLKAS